MNKKSKLFLAGIIGVVGNILAVGSACFAWFTGILAGKNDVSNMTVVQTQDAEITNMTIYSWDEKLMQGKSVEITDLSKISETDLALNEYDTYITSRNPKKAIFIKFEINVLNVPIEQKSFKARLTCVNADYTTTTGGANKSEWISNIINFGFFNNNSQVVPTKGTDLTEIYNACLDNINYTTKFVDTGGKTESTATMKKSQTINSGDDILLEAGTTKVELIMGYNYSSTLVSYYYNKVGKSESAILGGETIRFDKDIKTISFAF